MNAFGLPPDSCLTARIMTILGPWVVMTAHAEPDSVTPTFSEHIAQIVYKKCTTCHRPGQAAPFPLVTHRDVAKRGRLISKVTADRYMPPWHADDGPTDFAGDRRLTEREIQLIDQWVKAGTPPGPASALPPRPRFPEGWQLGEPDLVVTMSKTFSVPAEGPDIYRNFVLPLNLEQDRWVRAIEFRPSARSVVHHSLFFLDTSGEAREADKADPTPGFQRMGHALRRNDRLGGWAVGGNPRSLPDGLAYRLPAGSDLILSTHFHPSGKPESEKSSVAFYFAEKPPTRSFTGIQLPPVFGALAGVDIPPGDSSFTRTDSFVLPVDVQAFAVSAHAHYLGKSMTMTATLPDGATLSMLRIEDWDFSWQEQYAYSNFVHLPEGTRLDATIIWDNSSDNLDNPNSPPNRVRWGRQSTDEMGSITLRVATDSPFEMARLKRALAKHFRHSATSRFTDRIKNRRSKSRLPR